MTVGYFLLKYEPKIQPAQKRRRRYVRGGCDSPFLAMLYLNKISFMESIFRKALNKCLRSSKNKSLYYANEE